MGKKNNYPACPSCGTTDYDTNEEGTEGYCIMSCGAVFNITESGKAVLSDEVVQFFPIKI